MAQLALGDADLNGGTLYGGVGNIAFNWGKDHKAVGDPNYDNAWAFWDDGMYVLAAASYDAATPHWEDACEDFDRADSDYYSACLEFISAEMTFEILLMALTMP